MKFPKKLIDAIEWFETACEAVGDLDNAPYAELLETTANKSTAKRNLIDEIRKLLK